MSKDIGPVPLSIFPTAGTDTNQMQNRLKMVTMESDANPTPTVSWGQRRTVLWWLFVFLITSVAIAALIMSVRLTLATNTPCIGSSTGQARLVSVLVFRGHFSRMTSLWLYVSTPSSLLLLYTPSSLLLLFILLLLFEPSNHSNYSTSRTSLQH